MTLCSNQCKTLHFQHLALMTARYTRGFTDLMVENHNGLRCFSDILRSGVIAKRDTLRYLHQRLLAKCYVFMVVHSNNIAKRYGLDISRS